MKRKLAPVLLLAALAAMMIATVPVGAAPPPPTAGPKNPSFEQAFTFWVVPDLTLSAIVPGQVRQGGGTRFARLTAGAAGVPTVIDQTFNGAAGTTVTGFARFNDAEAGGFDDCPGFNDSALVSIDGVPVFQDDSCTIVGPFTVVWTYVLPITGVHTIHGEVMNGGDSALPSSLDMDAPLIAKVP
jgi:hypothetical protein